MNLPALTVGFAVLLIVAYRIYSRWLGRQFKLDDSQPTPAERINDGADFVPTRPFYLLGQHFSAIAAAGPIAGPILACQAFGWLPCLIWIALGAVFIGAAHDLALIIVSIRHGAKSITEIIRAEIGERAWGAMLIFIWISLLYVIVAFTDITAATFVGKSEEFEGGTFAFNPGGAVALAGILYLSLGVLMGIVEKFLRPPLWLLTIIFVPATLGAVWLGTKGSTLFLLPQATWGVVILVYCFIASLLPVWMLLQPRGYLGGFVLYLALAIGTLGLLFGGFETVSPAFKGWTAPTGALFPFLFVTIACGACSGFHGLICSGTTSKQVAKESHCRPIAYGGMLLESFVALIALATVMIAAPEETRGKSPGTIYGDGIARFMTTFVGPEHFRFAATFGAMAFSTFVFDTLDVCTRIGRYILEELFHLGGRRGAVIATAITVLFPLLVLVSSEPGAYRKFWTLFGTSNQLLAALSLLGISVWLHRRGKRKGFVILPMLFVSAVTLSALAMQIGASVNGLVSLGLAVLAGVLFVDGFKILFSSPKN